MDPEISFTITEENLETGLRHYPVGYCVTSSVEATTGLAYCRHPIKEMATLEPEQVLYLLYHGKEGSSEQVAHLFEELDKRKSLCDETIQQIYQLPQKGDPMKLFASALLILEMVEGSKGYEEDCLNILAKMPHLGACIINHHAGWGKTKAPDFSLGYMGAFADMLNIPNKRPLLKEVFSLFNILHYDHGGGNLSAFVGKVVASGLEGMYGSLSSAMCALAGLRHGSANEQTLAFVQQVHKQVGDEAKSEDIEKIITDRIEARELVYGFGHAVLRIEDPRASILYDFIQKKAPSDPLAKVALLLRTVGPKVLKGDERISNPYPNIDAVSGVYLCSCGFNYPQYFTLLFGLSRSCGIAIQIVYERLKAREGKGTPIIRPKFYYKDRT